MRRVVLGGLLGLVACGDASVRLAYPELGGLASVLFFGSEDLPLRAEAVDLDRRPEFVSLSTQLKEGQEGAVYALGFRDSLDALGLEAGLVPSAVEPNQAPQPDRSYLARYDGAQLLEWASLDALPGPLSSFRLPRSERCKPFGFKALPDFSRSTPLRSVQVDGTSALAMDREGLTLIDADGDIQATVPTPDPSIVALGRSPEGELWAVGAKAVALIHLDPLRYELVATGSIADHLIKWIAVEPGPDPSVYALSGSGLWSRVWPQPSLEVYRIPIVGADASHGGIVALDRGDLVTVSSYSSYVYRYFRGSVSRASPPSLVVGFDAAYAAGGQAIIAESPGGNLLRYDGEQFFEVPGVGVSGIAELTQLGERFIQGGKSGVLREYIEGGGCNSGDSSIAEIHTLAPLGKGLLVGTSDPEGRLHWLIAQPSP